MAKIRIVHYINQFFAGIGGEEKADIPPEIRKGKVARAWLSKPPARAKPKSSLR